MNPERFDEGGGQILGHVERNRIEDLDDLPPLVTKGQASVVLLSRGRSSLDSDPAIYPPLRRHR